MRAGRGAAAADQARSAAKAEGRMRFIYHRQDIKRSKADRLKLRMRPGPLEYRKCRALRVVDHAEPARVRNVRGWHAHLCAELFRLRGAFIAIRHRDVNHPV